MDSSDEEFIIDIQPEPGEQQRVQDDNPLTGNQKMGRLVFRETMGTDVKMITENCEVVDINTDQAALKMLSAGNKNTDALPVVTLSWDALSNTPLSFCQVHLHAGSECMYADVIHGLIRNNYRQLRSLTETIHSDYSARVTRIQDNPFGFGLAHESDVSLDEIGRVIEDLERDVQIVLSACVNKDISLELSLDLSGSRETTYDEPNTEPVDIPVPVEAPKEPHSGGAQVVEDTADNADETGCANEAGNSSTVDSTLGDDVDETERKFEDIEENLKAQRNVIEASFEEQRAQNEEMNTTLKSLMSLVQQKVSAKQSEESATESTRPSASPDLATDGDSNKASTTKGGQSDRGGRKEHKVVMAGTQENVVGPTEVRHSQVEPKSDTLEQSGQHKDTEQQNLGRQQEGQQKQQKLENPSSNSRLKLDANLSGNVNKHPLSNVKLSEVPHHEDSWNPDDRFFDIAFNRPVPLANSGKPENASPDFDSNRKEMPETSQGAAGGYMVDPKLTAYMQDGNLMPTHDNKISSPGKSKPQPQPRPPQMTGHHTELAQHFLKVHGVKGSSPEVRRLVKTVEMAMIDESPMPPKTRALDTILCLDTSSSMGQKGLKEMKDIAFGFIDALDDIAAKHEIEENLAVVTFGGQSKIEHHLSNDYTSVRERIDKLKLGGRSPLFEALLVCLCAINGRGGALSISGVHRVQPRLIIITDGKASDESEDSVGDVDHVDDNVKLRIIQLMQEFTAKKNQTTFPRPLVWVPVGNANESFLRSLAEIGHGQYMAGGLSVVQKLSQYQRIQEAVGKIFVCLQRQIGPETGDIRHDIDTIMGALVGDMEEEYKTEVIKNVMAKLEGKEGYGNEEQGPDGFDYIVEVDGLPPLGTRVTRGPDWHWGNQDTEGPGTIINHYDKHGGGKHLLYVQWDNGTFNQYRYGLDGEYDVWPAPDQPRLIASDMLIEVGCEVTRGPDWKDDYEYQDGGPGCVGVVIRKNDQGMVKVRWKQNCYIGSYRYGADGKLDLTVRDPGDILTELTRSDQGKLSTNVTMPEEVKVQEKGTWVWHWKDERNQWQQYTAQNNKKLEDQYRKRSTGSCLVQRAGKSYRVLFKEMFEKDLSNESRREVKRTCVDKK
ncbi:uncharacterized protein [Haliotis cracherodii]|uniref:uncharacterized protein n=1 Tax=Haliotis cracherodii TaxID=6455 RepID=UPI0039E9EFFD